MGKKAGNSKDIDIVDYVAALAKLNPRSEERDTLKKQLDETIKYISKLKEIDTSDVPLTSQVTGLKNVFREDVIDESRMFSQSEALKNAKRTHKGFFVIDAILEK